MKTIHRSRIAEKELALLDRSAMLALDEDHRKYSDHVNGMSEVKRESLLLGSMQIFLCYDYELTGRSLIQTACLVYTKMYAKTDVPYCLLIEIQAVIFFSNSRWPN